MAIVSFPYVSISGDRKYTATEIANGLDVVADSGVSATEGHLLCTKVPDSMQISVSPGKAIISGHLICSDAAAPLTLDAGDSMYTRYDIVVVESNNNTTYRSGRLVVVKGTPAASPVDPSLTQTVAVYQIPLCRVAVPAGAMTLNSAVITDIRQFARGRHRHKSTDIDDLAISTAALVDGAVTEAKVADGAITSGKISSGSISNAKLANGSVNVDKLANGAVSNDKLASGALGWALIASQTLSKTADTTISLPSLVGKRELLIFMGDGPTYFTQYASAVFPLGSDGRALGPNVLSWYMTGAFLVSSNLDTRSLLLTSATSITVYTSSVGSNTKLVDIRIYTR